MIFKKSVGSITNFILKKRLKYRQPRARIARNLATVKSVLILYHFNEEIHQDVHDLIRFLKEERKSVKTLGFISNKKQEMPKNKLSEEDFLRVGDLNFLKLPSGGWISNLLDEPYDLLLDLNQSERIPMKYIFSMSNAAFKVSGTLSYQQTYGDLTIDVSKDPSMKYQISQMKHYLTQINSNKVAYVNE